MGDDERDVLMHVDDGVAVITLNRPEVRNALRWDTWAQMGAALEGLAVDARVRVVVLTGAQGAFSSGGDVTSQGGTGSGIWSGTDRLRLAHEVLVRLHRLGKPTIAAVEGFAVGVGWSLALACDLVIAGDDAFFCAPFAQRALVPDGGLAWWLTRLVGPLRAAELVYFGRRLSATEAHAWGLIGRLAPRGDVLAEATAAAAELSELSADSLSLSKRLLGQASATTFDQYLALEELGVALNFSGPDVAEGRQAFLERRDPVFNQDQS